MLIVCSSLLEVDPFNLMNPGKVYPNIKPKHQ